MRRGAAARAMRPIAPLLCILLLAPLAQAQAGDRDYGAEVRGGAEVDVVITFDASTAGSRSGSQKPYALVESQGYDVTWTGTGRLYPSGGGKLTGGAVGTWSASPRHERTWDYASESSTLHEVVRCAARATGEQSVQLEGTPEATGIRLRIQGYVVPTFNIPGACQTSRVETTVDGTKSSEGASDFGGRVALAPLGADGGELDQTLLVPYEGRATLPLAYASPVPTTGDPGSAYCGMYDDMTWSSGTCSATGAMTARLYVDPCDYLVRRYAEDHDALAAVPDVPAGADEAAVRAWDAKNAGLASAVLADMRAFQLAGCAGELAPDPWAAIERVFAMKRDALLELAKQGKLSPQGAAECLAAERALQLLGSSSSADLSPVLAQAAPPAGTVEAQVHSPVSLHLYDEQGRHVGWSAATNASESTIPGATYTGAPGGAQRIVAPAGYYKLVVEELGAGTYVLDTALNASVATSESFLVDSRQGRTTSTHLAAVNGWDGPRLDAFPVRRVPTGAAFAFVDPGRPSLAGPDGAAGDDAGEQGANVPLPGAAMALVALGAMALARVRRR